MKTEKETYLKNELTVVDKLIEIIGRKLSYLYFFIVFISFYEIIARYLFNNPTDWVHETSIALAGFLMIYAGLFAYGRDKHIRVPILLDRLKGKWKNRLEIFGSIITLIYLGFLSYAGYFIAKSAAFSPTGDIMLERSGSAWNPVFPGFLKVSLFIFFVIFFIQVIWKLQKYFYSYNKGE
ncbi:TRAP transporter small permease subunit [Pasteurella testudinis]|uniref:TRAP transporter small permease subunit n=1 Tax=Pasteurella testudinis TaxID=761 RepID=UPI004058FCB9